MAKIKIEIDTDNDAFGDEPAIEVERILAKLAEEIGFNGLEKYAQADGIPLRDYNGNTVGTVEVKPSVPN
jgi:hypothetical protein